MPQRVYRRNNVLKLSRNKNRKDKIMNGLINGIYNLCSALQPLAGAILVLMIVIGGISTMVDGAEGRGRFKSHITYTLIGAALAFGAASLGKVVMGWFM